MNVFLSRLSPEDIEKFYGRISVNVRRIRKEKGFTQMDVALEIGIRSVAFFSNAENNKNGKHFNLEHLYRMAHAMDVDLCEFFKI